MFKNATSNATLHTYLKYQGTEKSREKTREVAPPTPEKSETKAEKQHSTELDWETPECCALTKNVGHSLCSPRQTPARTQRETDLKAMIQGTPIRDNKCDANTNFSSARLVLYCVSHASTVPHRRLGKI